LKLQLAGTCHPKPMPFNGFSVISRSSFSTLRLVRWQSGTDGLFQAHGLVGYLLNNSRRVRFCCLKLVKTERLIEISME
jgi:hypothetical protein